MALRLPPAAGTRRSRSAEREATAPTTSADSSRKRSNAAWSRTNSPVVAAVCESAGLRSYMAWLKARARGDSAPLSPWTTLLRSARVRGSSVLRTASRSTSDWVLSAVISPPSLISGPLFGPGLSAR